MWRLVSILIIIIININIITMNGDAVEMDDHHDQDPYRSAFHFQPPSHWMNDPNAPMIYKGIYHLFYQYYPYAAVWNTKIEWGHSTSTDLINWTPQPNALIPSESYDINGCWSGSATLISDDQPAILYTGGDSQAHQLQNLAFPKDLSDPYLKEWVKSPHNPVMVGFHSNKINASEFRDPSTAWRMPDGKWRVVVGTKNGKRGIGVLFTSKDFTTWVESETPLRFADGTGIWECPDLFPVYVGDDTLGADTSVIGNNVRHVLKLSLFDTQYEFYTIGTYDVEKDVYVPDEGSIESDMGLRLDYGKYYASKSFFDSKNNRRIVWAWVNESSIQADDIKKGWAGLQAIPRTIVLDKSGKQLVLWPITEVEMLRENQVDLPSQILKGESHIEVSGVTASQADVEVSFKIPEMDNLNIEEFDPNWTDPQILCSEKGASVKGGIGPFGLLTLASQDLEEYTAVFFRIFKAQNKYVVLMCSDQSKSSLNPTTDKLSYGTFVDVDPKDEELTLRILIDHSIVESFGARGKSCITARVYPTLAINDEAHLYAFNYGTEDVEITKLTAWNMKKAHINISEQISSTCATY